MSLIGLCLPDSRSVYSYVDIEESMKCYTATSRGLSNKI